MNVRSPQSAISLLEDFESRAIQNKVSAQFGGISVYHAIQPASEFEVTLTQHLLSVQLDTNYHNFRQVTHFAGQECRDRNNSGSRSISNPIFNLFVSLKL